MAQEESGKKQQDKASYSTNNAANYCTSLRFTFSQG